MVLKLCKTQVEEIIGHARAEAPLEACGLLTGRDASVERVHPMNNADRSTVSYRLDPEEQYRVFMETEDSGRELIGIYHSHPESQAYPSPRDVDMAYYPEAIYVIVSLTGRGTPEMRAFRIQDEAIREEQIMVIACEG